MKRLIFLFCFFVIQGAEKEQPTAQHPWRGIKVIHVHTDEKCHACDDSARWKITTQHEVRLCCNRHGLRNTDRVYLASQSYHFSESSPSDK